MKSHQIGNLVQDACQAALEKLQAGKTQWFYQRLYDTKSASSFLPNQPADFIGIATGRGFILEVKGSEAYGSLSDTGAAKKLIKSHQSLASYMAARAGGLGLVLFYSLSSGHLEIWDGAKVREMTVVHRGKLTLDACLVRGQCSKTDSELVPAMMKLLAACFNQGLI